MTNPYERFQDEELILRDELAIDRTLLANERTLLAYLRSGVALALAGVTFIYFSDQLWLRIVGFLCVPIGVVVLVIGLIRFNRMKAKIGIVRRQMVLREMPKKTQE